MIARPAFDPRQLFEVELHDEGEVTAWISRDSGPLQPEVTRRRSMSVSIDGETEIFAGLVLEASDPLVTFYECSECGLWECNLVEGWAAKVIRFGPYVFWLRPSGELFTFGAEEYTRALGEGIEALPTLTAEDAREIFSPDREVAYADAEGRSVLVDPDIAPDGPFAPLVAWPAPDGEGDVRPVLLPAEAIEVRATNGVSASLWIDRTPRADGHRAAFMPAVTAVPVWCAGPAVDRIIAALGR